MTVPFNKPLIVGTEKDILVNVIESGQFSANGLFTEKCHRFLETELNYGHALLTTSCTSALELAALLLGIESGDEVIIPSYAFVTTANAFASKGAKIVFADSQQDHPNIDEESIESLITPKTKAIVALHYGGVACVMDTIMAIAQKHNIKVIEDNAQGIGSNYGGNPLGGIGNLGAISFHDTKNVHCGEGGAFLVNDEKLAERASVIWDMGTNKADFKSGKVESYGWVDIGSSFYPSELNAAFLYAQFLVLEEVNQKRLELWQRYFTQLLMLQKEGLVKLPIITPNSEHNGHTFYLITKSLEERNDLIAHLGSKGITAPFHFQALHQSAYFEDMFNGDDLVNSERFSNCLIRLPLYHSLQPEEQDYVISVVTDFFEN